MSRDWVLSWMQQRVECKMEKCRLQSRSCPHPAELTLQRPPARSVPHMVPRWTVVAVGYGTWMVYTILAGGIQSSCRQELEDAQTRIRGNSTVEVMLPGL